MTKEESIIRVDASFNTLAYIREQISKGYSLEDIDNHCKNAMEACTKQLKLHNISKNKQTLEFFENIEKQRCTTCRNLECTCLKGEKLT